MPVDRNYVPTESFPFLLERVQPEAVFSKIDGAYTVAVNDSYQVVELVVSGENRCFPYRSFVALSVAQHNHGHIFLRIHFCSQGEAIAHPEAVSERTPGGFNAGDISGHITAVRSQKAAVLAVALQFSFWEKPDITEYGLKSDNSRTFTYNKPVSLFPSVAEKLELKA